MRPNSRKFPSIPAEMRAWSAALGAEVSTWPQCRARAFFGFSAFYRRENIFALLPRTRALHQSHSIALKLESAGPRILNRAKRDPRMSFTEMQKKRWFTFALSCDADMRDALEWLSHDYEAAG